MKVRFSLGFILLGLLFLLGLFTSRQMKRICAPMEHSLYKAVSAAQQEDWPQALTQAQAAQERWNTYRELLKLAADQTPMDDTDRLFAQVQVYAQARDAEHFAACCAELAVMAQAISDAHSFGLPSLF